MSESVHVLLGYVRYEDTNVVGVYSDNATAETAKEQYETAVVENDRDNAPLSKSGERAGHTGQTHYDGFYIEEWEVAADA